MVRVIISFLISLTVFSSPAHAQKAPVKADSKDVICVGGRSWRPTFAESRAIETTPVPESYRVMFGSTQPCVKWAMAWEGIVDWHLRFGSAASVSAALGYIKANGRLVPPPATYLPLLRAAFAAEIGRAHV